MKEIDELDLKAEIDQIAKRIDAIVQQVERFDPTVKENQETDQE